MTKRSITTLCAASSVTVVVATHLAALAQTPNKPRFIAETPLLQHASKVTHPPFVLEGYQWVSPNIILFYFLDGDAGWRAARVNVTTQHVTSFRGDQFIQDASASLYDASPDGRWLAGWTHDGSLEAISLAGERVRLWHDDWVLTTFWLPGSRHLLVVVSGDHEGEIRARIHDVNGPDIQGPSIPFNLVKFMLIGVTTNRHLFCIWPDDHKIALYDFDLTGTHPMQRVFITPPGDADWYESAVSPRGDRIAYLFNHNSGNNPPRVYKISLWVSHADGTQMREVGVQAIGKGSTATSDPSRLLWLPDGKHLSFLLNDNLYTVPAD